jgi:transcription elongation factor GreB
VSRAFVKEDDGAPDEPLPERPVSEHPNYVTRSGLARLVARVEELEAERLELARRDDEDDGTTDRLRYVERDLRYYRRRLETAAVIDSREVALDAPAAAAGGSPDVVAFGMMVTVDDGSGLRQRYTIVGEDEADPDAGLVSWVSPLAKVLDGARVGDHVVWRRPAGALELVVVAIGYKEDPAEQTNGTS